MPELCLFLPRDPTRGRAREESQALTCCCTLASWFAEHIESGHSQVAWNVFEGTGKDAGGGKVLGDP